MDAEFIIAADARDGCASVLASNADDKANTD